MGSDFDATYFSGAYFRFLTRRFHRIIFLTLSYVVTFASVTLLCFLFSRFRPPLSSLSRNESCTCSQRIFSVNSCSFFWNSCFFFSSAIFFFFSTSNCLFLVSSFFFSFAIFFFFSASNCLALRFSSFSRLLTLYFSLHALLEQTEQKSFSGRRGALHKYI